MASFPIEIPDGRYFERLIRCRERCPVHTDARGYVQAASRGDWILAYRIARGPNPFASICGRVCGAPCERACTRGKIDDPVSIRALKRAATERQGVEAGDLRASLALSTAPGSVDPTPRKERVAVIGAGVAGLAAAHDLARLGFRVTVFEANEQPGGMLTTGVPIFRLDRAVVQKEIAAIQELGVEIKCGVRVGSSITLKELHEQGFDAVLLAVGLQQARMLDLPGADLPGVVGGLDYLRAFNGRKPVEPMGNVIVIGGGNVAYDCARSAVRTAGTTSVTLVSLEALHEMPADKIEIEEGDEEGIVRRNRFGPARYVAGPDGRLSGLEVRTVSRVFDENGRFSPQTIPGTEQIFPCDTVLVAVGQSGDTGFVTGLPGLELGRGGTVIADRETGRTSIPWLFGAGDAALGPGLFIDAIAHGRRAAKAISVFLDGAQQVEEAERIWEIEAPGLQMRRDTLVLPRLNPGAAPVEQRLKSVDLQVEVGFSETTARDQGSRCLRCDVETIFDGAKCIQCGGCADVCPTWCLRLVSLDEIGMASPENAGMSAIIKDEERCLRCGMCAKRCPTGAVTMERLCGFEPWTTLPSRAPEPVA